MSLLCQGHCTEMDGPTWLLRHLGRETHCSEKTDNAKEKKGEEEEGENETFFCRSLCNCDFILIFIGLGHLVFF